MKQEAADDHVCELVAATAQQQSAELAAEPEWSFYQSGDIETYRKQYINYILDEHNVTITTKYIKRLNEQ